MQAGAPAFEVLVVDDLGTEECRRRVREFRERLDVHYLVGPRRFGAAAARNAGAAAAAGEYLVFVDDDCVPNPDWLAAYLSAIDGAGTDARHALFGGGSRNAFPDNAFATASQTLIDFLMAWYNSDGRHPTFFPSNNICCASSTFRAVGGFDERFPRAGAEDRDFCERVLSRGGHLVPVPSAIVVHDNRTTLSSFLAQHFGYGRGAAYLAKARTERTGGPVRLESGRFYRRLVLAPPPAGHARRAVALPALLLLSQVAYAAGYYLQRLIGTHALGPAPTRGPTHTPVSVVAVPPGRAAPRTDRRPRSGATSD